jgi:hypothetical protein
VTRLNVELYNFPSVYLTVVTELGYLHPDGLQTVGLKIYIQGFNIAFNSQNPIESHMWMLLVLSLISKSGAKSATFL